MKAIVYYNIINNLLGSGLIKLNSVLDIFYKENWEAFVWWEKQKNSIKLHHFLPIVHWSLIH